MLRSTILWTRLSLNYLPCNYLPCAILWTRFALNYLPCNYLPCAILWTRLALNYLPCTILWTRLALNYLPCNYLPCAILWTRLALNYLPCNYLACAILWTRLALNYLPCNYLPCAMLWTRLLTLHHIVNQVWFINYLPYGLEARLWEVLEFGPHSCTTRERWAGHDWPYEAPPTDAWTTSDSTTVAVWWETVHFQYYTCSKIRVNREWFRGV